MPFIFLPYLPALIFSVADVVISNLRECKSSIAGSTVQVTIAGMYHGSTTAKY